MAIADYYSLASHQEKCAELATIVSLTLPVMRIMKSVLPKYDGFINKLLRFAFPLKGNRKVQMHSDIWE